MGTIAEMAFAPSSANVGLLNLDTSSADAASARDLRSMQLQGEAIKNEAERTKQEKMAQAEQYFRQNGISEESIKNYGAQTGDIATTQVLLENYNNLLKQKDDQETAKLEHEKTKNELLNAQKEALARIGRSIDVTAIAPTPKYDDKGQPIPQTDEERKNMIANQVKLGIFIKVCHENGILTPADVNGQMTPPDQVDWSQQDPNTWKGFVEGLTKSGTTVAQQILENDKQIEQQHKDDVLENTIKNQETQRLRNEERLRLEKERVRIDEETLSLAQRKEAQRLAEKKKQEEIEKGNKIADYDDTIQVIDQLATHKGTPGLVGLKSASSFWGLTKEPINGTPEAGAKALYDAFVAKMTLANMGKIKGTLSDSDMRTLKAASTTLSTTTDEQQFKSELKRVRTLLERSKYNIAHDIYYEGDKIVKNKNYDEQTETKPSTGTKKSIKPGEVFKHSNGVTIQRVE